MIDLTLLYEIEYTPRDWEVIALKEALARFNGKAKEHTRCNKPNLTREAHSRSCVRHKGHIGSHVCCSSSQLILLCWT